MSENLGNETEAASEKKVIKPFTVKVPPEITAALFDTNEVVVTKVEYGVKVKN